MTIVLIGTVLLAIMNASIAGIKASSASTNLAQIETVLQNAADRVNRAPLKCDYGQYVAAAAQAVGWPPGQATATYRWYQPGADATATGSWHRRRVQHSRRRRQRRPTRDDHDRQPQWKGDSFDGGGQEQCLTSNNVATPA